MTFRSAWAPLLRSALLTVILIGASPSEAQEGTNGYRDVGRDVRGSEGASERRSDRGEERRAHPRAVPELDPAAAGAIGTLLAGGALLFAARRRRS